MSELHDSKESTWDDINLNGCPDCNDEGYIVGPCFEDSCCCSDPESQHDLIPCPTCGGAK